MSWQRFALGMLWIIFALLAAGVLKNPEVASTVPSFLSFVVRHIGPHLAIGVLGVGVIFVQKVTAAKPGLARGITRKSLKARDFLFPFRRFGRPPKTECCLAPAVP